MIVETITMSNKYCQILRSFKKVYMKARLTRIRLNRAFSLGGNGFDEGIVMSLGVPGVLRVFWWPYGAEQEVKGSLMMMGLPVEDDKQPIWPLSLGQQRLLSPWSRIHFSFFGLVFGNSSIFFAAASATQEPHKSSTLNFGKQWKYLEKIHW